MMLGILIIPTKWTCRECNVIIDFLKFAGGWKLKGPNEHLPIQSQQKKC